LEKVDERIQKATKKDAAMDTDYYERLAGELDYCDLRKLQDTITGKSLWTRFSDGFSEAWVRFGRPAMRL